MRKSFILVAALLISCGSSTCKSGEQPPPAAPPVVSVPDAGPIAEPSAEPKPAPKLVIDWKTPDQIFEIGKAYSNLCMMAYFPDAVGGNRVIETTTFMDPELIKLLNRTFIAMEFPITEKNEALVMEEFAITKLPTLIFAPANEGLVFQVEGDIPADKLTKAIEDNSAEGKIFETCADARHAVQDKIN